MTWDLISFYINQSINLVYFITRTQILNTYNECKKIFKNYLHGSFLFFRLFSFVVCHIFLMGYNLGSHLIPLVQYCWDNVCLSQKKGKCFRLVFKWAPMLLRGVNFSLKRFLTGTNTIFYLLRHFLLYLSATRTRKIFLEI